LDLLVLYITVSRMKTGIHLLILSVLSAFALAVSGDKIVIDIETGEYWWGGLSSKGHEGPYDIQSNAEYDLWGDNYGNQAQPLLLSNKGRFIWSEDPIEYRFKNGKLIVTSETGKIRHGKKGKNLKDVYGYVCKEFFPPDGKIPDELLFTKPQYNTWIELMYDQNEEDILNYARDLVDMGYPPGVLMIDDNWQTDYGIWEFSADRFSDPRGMVEQLHEMGFKVMLWICPFVSPDSEVFRHLAAEGMFLVEEGVGADYAWKNTKSDVAIIRWWNGASACLDLSNPKSRQWFKGRLDYLVEEFGIDGFKFDAGDAGFYTGGVASFRECAPNEQTRYFAELALDYPLNEFRASWKMAGLPLALRLRDKGHNWEDLQKLIPDQMSQSVMGYAYTCPDMIGGGEFRSFLNASTIDEELVVRSAQVHALMPMMQFSVAPWRVLSEKNQEICLEMARLHEDMGDEILALANSAARTGKPIVQPMALAFPDNGYETIKDQFMLGDNIMVAPVVEKGARARKIVLPQGRWRSEKGDIVQGGSTIDIEVPLERLPYFTRLD